MTRRNSKRTLGARAAALVAAAAMAAAAAANAPAAQQPAAKAPEVPRYRVTVAPKVILPPEQPATGTELALTAGQEFLRARLGWLRAATIEEDLTLSIAGESATLPRGTILLGALASGGDLQTLPRGAQYFCADERHSQARGIANLLTLGIASGGQRVRINSRFCVVDGDGDSRFERAFLVGTRRSEDRHLVDIEPVRYAAQTGMPMPGESEIRISYRSGANFRVQVVENGQRQTFGTVATLAGPQSILHTGGNLRARARRLPQRMVATSAAFTVLGFDPEANTARVRIDNDFGFAPYQLVQRPQTIYIYIPR